MNEFLWKISMMFEIAFVAFIVRIHVKFEIFLHGVLSERPDLVIVSGAPARFRCFS